jgi:hypothetical protein
VTAGANQAAAVGYGRAKIGSSKRKNAQLGERPAMKDFVYLTVNGRIWNMRSYSSSNFGSCLVEPPDRFH